MRIAFVTETWLPTVDGVVTRLRHTVDALERLGHTVLVIAPTRDPSRSTAQLRIPAATLRMIDRRRRIALPLAAPVTRALASFEPDVVHIVNPVFMGAVVARALRGRHRIVVSFHTDLDAYAARYRLGAARWILRALMRMAYGAADLVLATSPEGAARLARLHIAADLWPPGIDATVFSARVDASPPPWLDLAPDRVDAVVVGRLAPEKNVAALVPVLAAAVTRSRSLRLTLIGDGPERARLEQRFAWLPATFVGSRNPAEIAAAFVAADVLLLPSTSETVGLVLLEAAAMGLPIVAADTPAARHTLSDVRAFFVPPDAGPPEWLDQIAAALSAGRQTPPRIPSWESVTEDLVASYERIAARSAGIGSGVS